MQFKTWIVNHNLWFNSILLCLYIHFSCFLILCNPWIYQLQFFFIVFIVSVWAPIFLTATELWIHFQLPIESRICLFNSYTINNKNIVNFHVCACVANCKKQKSSIDEQINKQKKLKTEAKKKAPKSIKKNLNKTLWLWIVCLSCFKCAVTVDIILDFLLLYQTRNSKHNNKKRHGKINGEQRRLYIQMSNAN